MKRILSITAAALLVSAAPALAQTTVEGGVSGSGTTVLQPGAEASGTASGSVTVETDPGTTASIDLSTEQQTELRTVLVQDASPVELDADITIGATVPGTVEFRPLPPRFVEIVPQYQGYRYIVLADGRIVIVKPDAPEVVYIMS